MRLSIDFDLRERMLRYLEIEKDAVREQLEEYFSAMIVVITPTGEYYRQVSFQGEDEKIAAYAAIVDEAKRESATIIVTVNAARTGYLAPDESDGYWWGRLAAEGARDCISIVASGPGMQSVALDVGYNILRGAVRFDEPEFNSTEVGLLPDWPGANSLLRN